VIYSVLLITMACWVDGWLFWLV